jgi:hypothetical protein
VPPPKIAEVAELADARDLKSVVFQFDLRKGTTAVKSTVSHLVLAHDLQSVKEQSLASHLLNQGVLQGG